MRVMQLTEWSFEHVRPGQRPDPIPGPFADTDLEQIATMMPHVLRATLIQRRWSVGAVRAAAGMAALERSGSGVLLRNGSGRILWANGVAERLLRAGDGLVSVAGAFRRGFPPTRRCAPYLA